MSVTTFLRLQSSRLALRQRPRVVKGCQQIPDWTGVRYRAHVSLETKRLSIIVYATAQYENPDADATSVFTFSVAIFVDGAWIYVDGRLRSNVGASGARHSSSACRKSPTGRHPG